MTVCLGALCANQKGEAAKVIVVASDRMVTLAGLTEFEHEVPKIQNVNEHFLALIAGDALRGSRLVRKAATTIPTGSSSASDIAALISKTYAELRLEQLDSDVFQPRSMNISDFYNGGIQQRLMPQIAGQIDMFVAEYDYGVSLLMAGVDDAGAHLFSVANPGGSYNDHAPIGYHAIGSGWLHALQSMISFGHTSQRDLNETVYAVYASKRRAEVAPGVGLDTDMMIVSDTGGNQKLTQAQLEKLRKLYDEQQKPVRDEIKEQMNKIKLFEGGEK